MGFIESVTKDYLNMNTACSEQHLQNCSESNVMSNWAFHEHESHSTNISFEKNYRHIIYTHK